MSTCPACSKVFCSRCGKKWTNGHSQVNCKPNEHGIGADDDLEMYTNATCPQCKYKYFLERGGCMHITCSQVNPYWNKAIHFGNEQQQKFDFKFTVQLWILRILLQKDNGQREIVRFSKLSERAVVTRTSSEELYVLCTGNGLSKVGGTLEGFCSVTFCDCLSLRRFFFCFYRRMEFVTRWSKVAKLKFVRLKWMSPLAKHGWTVNAKSQHFKPTIICACKSWIFNDPMFRVNM